MARQATRSHRDQRNRVGPSHSGRLRLQYLRPDILSALAPRGRAGLYSRPNDEECTRRSDLRGTLAGFPGETRAPQDSGALKMRLRRRSSAPVLVLAAAVAVAATAPAHACRGPQFET